MEHVEAGEAEKAVLLQKGKQPKQPAVRGSGGRAVCLIAALVTGAVLFELGRKSTLGSLLPEGTLGSVLPKGATDSFLSFFGHPSFTGLNEDSFVCDDLPFLRIEGVESNNLGSQGPDKDKPEGLIYAAKAFNTGLGDLTDVQVHLHVISSAEFTHSEAEGPRPPATYEPAWPAENGIRGHFAVVNVKPGTNVTLRVHGYNPAAEEQIRLPKAALTFFDLDAGKDGVHSTEFVRMEHYEAYFLTDRTEIQVSHEEGSTTFRASKEGSGDDNPQNPLQLTAEQKNRVVSFEFEDADEVVFQLGASAGSAPRVFSFVMRPALRCASTLLKDGTVLPANATHAPIAVVRGAGEHARPLLRLLLGLTLASSLQSLQ